MKKFKCSKCNEEKDAAVFSPDKRKISGLSSICKNCRNAFIKDKRERIRGYSAPEKIRHIKNFKESGVFSCYSCKEEKASQFFDREKRNPTGHSYRCKQCAKKYNADRYLKNKEPFLAKSKEHYVKAKHLYKIRARKSAMKKNYGLSIAEADQLMVDADFSCQICKIHQSNLKRRLSIDHNHLSGKVRGILCYSCNHAIGRLKSDYGVELLQNAIEYIKRTDNY